MMNFCTLFDSYYIHKGIALYLSLENVTDDFTLYVMAFDDKSYEKLSSLAFKHMVVERLADFETPELLAVKPTRNKAEYCWTCGPSVTWHFMKKYQLPGITYLDSDLFFLSDPKVIQDEIGSRSLAVTEHYTKGSDVGGRFCVQYMYFRNDEEGCAALSWWRDRCLEWCFARYEDGKFGDQKYIDAFPERYKNLCIVQNKGAGIAPWNYNLYKYFPDHCTFDGQQHPYVFFHMHGTVVNLQNGILRFEAKKCILSKMLSTLFFGPYTNLLRKVYTDCLGQEVRSIEIISQSRLSAAWIRFRAHFKENKLFQYLYFHFINRNFSGREKAKI